MKCDICEINEADNQTPKGGNFCTSCESKFMEAMGDVNNMKYYLSAMGDENKMENLTTAFIDARKRDDFSEIISVDDVDRIAHEFEISNMTVPGFCIWKAEETKGGYKFYLFVKHEENQATAIEQLRQKIVTGLGYKTLEHLSESIFADNEIQIGEDHYGLNNVGTCRIQTDEANTVSLVIDGKTIPLEEFGQVLTEFEGFNMDFQIRDVSDDVLGKDMALRQVNIHPEVIIDHFEKTLGWFLESNFLSGKREIPCIEALTERVCELEQLYQRGNRDEAVAVGKRMKKRLTSIDHDADNFPNYLLEMINRVINITE